MSVGLRAGNSFPGTTGMSFEAKEDWNMSEIQFCKGGGCTAKLGPGILERVLSRLPKGVQDPNLLIGYDSSDDAAVYQLSEDTAIVQTLDFFPPMVEDPYTFGQIAATNALSDVYAMGGDPITALNIVCFPQTWDLNILGEIMRGGAEKVQEAGASLCGGHSINDADVKYGLSVTGRIHPKRVFANIGCQRGDALILTKPLGVGIVCTAMRVGEASKEAQAAAIRSMTTLNKYASELIRKYEVHACTDVTGFGFMGHLCEMLSGSKEEREKAGLGHLHTAYIDADKVPCLPEVPAYVEEFYLTAAAQRNRNHTEGRVRFENCEFWQEELLFDAQTSGGLLVSMGKADAEKCIQEIRELGLPCGIVGEICAPEEKAVVVRRG